MSPDQQRTAIAKVCGWTDIRRQRLYAGDQDLWGNKLTGGEKHRNRLPDYLNDLNDCHEMEQVLSGEQKEQFIFWLNHLHPSADIHYAEKKRELRLDVFDLVHTTASHRAEAFLRTLNLWTESPTQPTQNQ
jgi:hypothetical protein